MFKQPDCAQEDIYNPVLLYNALVPTYKRGNILFCNSFKDYKEARLMENAVIDTGYVYYTEKTWKKSISRMFLT